MSGELRIGVDVGGTFTKAVAVSSNPLRVHAHAAVPTTHASPIGVAEGVAEALRALARELGPLRDRVRLAAFSTTQAMNALLEGDVGEVAVIGIGYRPALRVARRRTRVGAIALAPGRELRTTHHFVDASAGFDADAVAAEVGDVSAVAVSGAFSVDAPDDERAIADAARRRGIPACAGHELTGAYGLETRTVSAAINASILPVVERTATRVAAALGDTGLDVPLLVLRGDGGSMSMDAFRRHPSLTIGSAPAAGVAAVLHELRLKDGIVVECGGTSTNVSVVRGGRPELRTLRVMGRPTAVRAVDSWVVGVAGGSMPLLRRRKLADVGPRSAHVAGLRYASFAEPAELAGARLVLVAPRAGDPAAYAAVDAEGGRFALTATCAANALGVVPAGAHPAGSGEAARAAFAALGDDAARTVLGLAVRRIAAAVDEAARQYRLPADVPLVALGGAGAALVPELGRLLGREVVLPDHAEVLSAIGAAVSLIRAEVVRTLDAGVDVEALAREAEAACVEAGAAPATVTTETTVDNEAHVIRAVATGAVALEAGGVDHRPAADDERAAAAGSALGIAPSDLAVVASNAYYRVYRQGAAGTAVVDRFGRVALAEASADVVAGTGESFVAQLEAAVTAASTNLGVATMLPRVTVISGARLLDLSTAGRVADVVEAAARVARGSEPAFGIVAR